MLLPKRDDGPSEYVQPQGIGRERIVGFVAARREYPLRCIETVEDGWGGSAESRRQAA